MIDPDLDSWLDWVFGNRIDAAPPIQRVTKTHVIDLDGDVASVRSQTEKAFGGDDAA